MRYLFFIPLAALLLMAQGCINNSALIPTEVTSISQIRFQGSLLQDRKNGKPHQLVRVRIRNKNDELIAIDGGAVYFGKRKMPFVNYLFNTPQYELESYRKDLFRPDSTYKFTVMLKDSSKYFFYIHTPEKDLIEFNAPARIDSGQSFVVSWQEVCNENPTRLNIEFAVSENGKAVQKKLFLPVTDPSAGHFTVAWSNFAPYTKLHNIHLELYFETEGYISPYLLDNSYLRAQFKLTNDIYVP